MPKFQLIVKTQDSPSRGESISIDMLAETIKEAREEAKRRLRGDPHRWKGQLDSWHDEKIMRTLLDPDGHALKELGPAGSLFLDSRHIYVASAHIVRYQEDVDVDQLRDEIKAWQKIESARLEREHDEAELERLRKKLTKVQKKLER